MAKNLLNKYVWLVETIYKAKKGAKQPAAPQFSTYPKMLLEVLDWLTEQNATQGSEYYHCLALDKVAAMGQSCEWQSARKNF